MSLSESDLADLAALSEDVFVQMRESVFVKKLLPHLVPSDDPNAPKRNVDIYVAATGHPSRMIQVVSDSNQKEVLYVVPPLIPQTPTAILSENNIPYTSMRVMAEEFEGAITTNHPGYVIDSYVQRLMALNHTPVEAMSAVYGRMWAMIYIRYGIPLERLFGKENAQILYEEFGKADAMNAKQSAKNTGQDFNDLNDDDFESM